MDYKGYLIEPNNTGYVNFNFYKPDSELISGNGNSIEDCQMQIDEILKNYYTTPDNFKFRAWDESQKYMAIQGTPDLETLQSFIFHFGDKKLMLFIGHYDKNGKEIYQGDILHKPNMQSCPKFIIEWDKNRLQYIEIPKNSAGLPDTTEFTVIGNIFETPELL